MKTAIGDLWRPTGTIGRGAYALVGLLGFAFKHNLDRLVATYGFHRPWGPFNYWVPVRDVARITELRGGEAVFLETMVALALPFIWIGVVLTMKRLRSAGLPLQLVAFFFIPFLNLLFFLILCLVPERNFSSAKAQAETRAEPPVEMKAEIMKAEMKKGWFLRALPDSALGSAAVALLITVPLGLGAAAIGIQILANYGWGLFVALPFIIGFAAALIYGIRQPRSLGGCVGVACLSISLLGIAFLAVAFEGMICLIMATPIALPLAAFGGVCGYAVQRRRRFQSDAPVLLSALLLLAPGVEWAEHAVATPAPAFVVRTAIDVQAPPERVWQKVIAFSEIPPPTEWTFRAGVAYPIRAQMLGSGAGAERHCVFSTGAFVEPITVWDEPRLLKFSVTSNPPPLEEWTPYSHIAPPHLHGFLVSEGGQFLLTPLANGGTRLEGTTWYQHHLRPATYWQLWSDPIIHQIHMRVLRHIRDEAERAPR
jgi:hypothetical protein